MEKEPTSSEKVEAENKYPENIEELSMELHYIITEANFFLEAFPMSEERLNEEIKKSLINTAKEIIDLFKNPEKKVQWPSGWKDWKEELDILRLIPKEMSEAQKEREQQNEELKEEFKELKSFKKETKEQIFRKKINNIEDKIKQHHLPYIDKLIKNIEIEFQKFYQNNDFKEEERIWRTLHELNKMDLKSFKEINNLFSEIEEEFKK